MSEEKQPRRHPYRSILAAAVFVLLGILATAGFKSYRELATVRAHEADLERQIEAAEERITQLRHHVDLIENDSETLERRAREDLGMVRPHDVVIILPEDDVAPLQPEASPKL